MSRTPSHQPTLTQQMTPFDILGDLPRGTTLLEASAGTGKTWTIGALVARFVAEGHARLDEMLVVTFGRAASQELRQRVRQQLVELDTGLRNALDPEARDGHDAGGTGSPRADDHLDVGSATPNEVVALLCTGERAELVARRERVSDALAHFDGATIATIHQFCQQVLRGLGVAGDTDPSARLVEDVDDLRDEVVDDLYLRGFVDAERPAFGLATARELARIAVADPQSEIVPLDAAAGTEADRRVRFCQVVRAELDRRKQRAGLLNYDDLLGQLARALAAEDAPARIRMRQRWKVVLVDEFQDTDPVQWQVFDRAFNGHATMVLIGDPKQAIYAFRGGDVTTYLDASASADLHQTLAVNWRSDAALVAATGRLLEGAALGDERIVVHPVSAQHTVSRLQGAPCDAPLRLRVVERSTLSPATRPRDPLRMPVLRPHVDADCARDIAALLDSGAQWDGRALLAGDIAVLAPKRKQLAAIQEALRAVGVRAVLAGGGSVFATRAAREWLTLLEAIAAPHRSSLVRAAALTPFLGESVTVLDTDSDGATERAATTMRSWADLLAQRGVAAVFESAVRRGLVARVLGTIDGERHLTDLRHVAEALHLAGRGDARGEARGLVGLLAWLRQEIDTDDRDGVSERTRRLDSDASAVQLATIHASKGLQYPVVYLPWLCDRYVSSEATVPRFHLPSHGDPEGRHRRAIDVGGPGGPQWQSSQAHHRAEGSGESLRLLYVAMTRAQSQVVTWWAPASNTPASPLHRLLFGRQDGGEVLPNVALQADPDAVRALREHASSEISVEPSVVATGPTERATPSVHPLAVRRFDREIDLQWRRTSYSSLAAGGSDHRTATSEPEVEVRDDEELPDAVVTSAGGDAGEVANDLVSPMSRLPVGATFGSLVHAVLEHVDLAGSATAEELRVELAAQVAEQRRWWPVPGLDDAELVDALVSVSASPLGPLSGGRTLRDIARRDTLRELDFELPLAGGDAARRTDGAVLGDLADLLRTHLPHGDPVRSYADVLDADRRLAAQRLRGYLGGSIDVVLRLRDAQDERYLVVDYKTNWLGPRTEATVLRASAYRPAALEDAMRGSDYPLQALLYSVVAHRFLRWRLADYDPARHLGGVLYLYLRGMCGAPTPTLDGGPCGVFTWRPPVALVEAVSDLLDGARAGSAEPNGGVA